MAAGELLGAEQRSALERAVADAESSTGLQLCVYLGPAEGDPRQHAERLLSAARARSRPAVMLYVAPDARRVECVVAPAAVGRVDDRAARAAVDAMLPLLRQDELVPGIAAGLRVLADAAGPPTGDEPPEELPNVLG